MTSVKLETSHYLRMHDGKCKEIGRGIKKWKSYSKRKTARLIGPAEGSGLRLLILNVK